MLKIIWYIVALACLGWVMWEMVRTRIQDPIVYWDDDDEPTGVEGCLLSLVLATLVFCVVAIIVITGGHR